MSQDERREAGYLALSDDQLNDEDSDDSEGSDSEDEGISQHPRQSVDDYILSASVDQKGAWNKMRVYSNEFKNHY